MAFMFVYVLTLTILLFTQNAVSFEGGNTNTYNDVVQNINKISKLIKVINKSPTKYEESIRAIADTTHMKNVFRQLHLQADEFLGGNIDFSARLAADNVTGVPFNGSSTESGMTTESVTIMQSTLQPAPSISELCFNHSEAVTQGLTERQPWALRMIDAAGKPPANILGGGRMWLGDFDECLAVQAVAAVNNITYRFAGQYCKVYIPVQGEIAKIIPAQTVISLGVCVPNSCSGADVTLLVNTALSGISGGAIRSYSGDCQETDLPFDTRAIIVLIVVSLFIVVMVLGTAYDVIFIQWPKWQQVKLESKVRDNSVAEAKESESKMNGEIIDTNEKVPLLPQSKIQPLAHQPGIGGKLLLSFSVYTNGAKILSTEQSKEVLTSINGIRFLSMTWVILGHSYQFPLQMSDNVAAFFPKMLSRWTFGAVANALVSVDTFFTLSGCLLTYLVMKELKRNNGRLKWGMFYFHRFWRLTPPYMLILMVYVSLFHYTGSGPNWIKEGPEVNHCEKAWYYNILYINNFFDDRENSCMGWSWYLACDMQFFVLSPLIILPLFYYEFAGIGVMLVFLLATWITTGVTSAHYDISASPFDGGDNTHFNKIYFRSYCRMGPYLVGMYTGYLLYKYNCKFYMKKIVNLIGWAIATGTALLVLYGLYDDINGERLSTDVAALYNTVHRTVWGACVAWVIFACATGYGGFVNTLLSWKGFIPLSRLTYMAYLVHIIIMDHYLLTYQRTIHLTDSEYIYQFLGHLVLSYMAAFVTSLAFESPMMGLERVIFKRNEVKR